MFESIRKFFTRYEEPQQVDEGAILKELMEGAASEAIDEAVSSGDLILARDEAGWLSLINPDGSLNETLRRAVIRKSRRFASRESMCKHIIRLWTDFGVGDGFDYRVKRKPLEKKLDAFWDNPLNRVLLSQEGQRQSSRKLLIDGVVYFVFFGLGTTNVTVRWLDPLQMVDRATHPEDEWRTMYHIREIPVKDSGKTKRLIYKDWLNIDGEPGEDRDGNPINDATEGDALVLRIALDPIMYDGEPLLMTVVDWGKALRSFMRNRVSIMESIAQFVWKLRTKGGSKAVSAQRTQYNSTVGTSGSETNPKATAGSTWIENEAASREPIRQDTGANAAQVDGGMLIQHMGAGAGIFPHYLGAGESFKLATATAMEPPMFKQFSAYNGLWASTYQTMLELVVTDGNIIADGGKIRKEIAIDGSDIYPSDTKIEVEAMKEILTLMPDFAFSEEVQKKAIQLLGLKNPEQIVEEIGKIFSGVPKPPEPQTNPPENSGEQDDDEPEAEEAVIESTARYRSLIMGLKLAHLMTRMENVA